MVTKINDMELRILSLFTQGYNKEYYIREVEKLLKISSRTALVTLAKLEKKGVLTSKKRGKIKTYAINKNGLAREYFVLTEQYKKLLFLQKNPLIKEVLEKTETYRRGIVILFGSYAKGTEKEDSDLDLFIAGSCDEEKMKEMGRRYHIDISIKKYPLKLFEKGINDDILIREVIEHHVIINDCEGFVRRVLPWIRERGVENRRTA